jgi:hypothetical protein
MEAKMVCPNCLVYAREERGGEWSSHCVCAYCGEPALIFLTDEQIKRRRAKRESDEQCQIIPMPTAKNSGANK